MLLCSRRFLLTISAAFAGLVGTPGFAIGQELYSNGGFLPPSVPSTPVAPYAEGVPYVSEPTYVDAQPLGKLDESAVEGEVIEGFELPELIDPSRLKTIDGFLGGVFFEDECEPRSRRYSNYRAHEGSWSYLPGDGDQFGWIDFEDAPYIARGSRSGWTGGMGLHLLSGPNSIDLPPRLWDFILGYQVRDTISDRFSYDVAATVGVYSDFEDSARDGVRFPAHAVGMLHMNEAWDLVGGVDYLDRDDYKILPVFGFSWHSPEFPNWNVDLVFPRPRVDFALSGSERFYIGGLLGGGTWDIEMPGEVNDVLTYRDLRLLFGLEQLHEEGRVSAIELGYVFGRQVEFRSLQPGAEFDDAFVIRWVSRR